MTTYATELNPPMKIFCVRHWQQPTENQNNTVSEIWAKWWPGFCFGLPEMGAIRSSALVSYLTERVQ